MTWFRCASCTYRGSWRERRAVGRESWKVTVRKGRWKEATNSGNHVWKLRSNETRSPRVCMEHLGYGRASSYIAVATTTTRECILTQCICISFQIHATVYMITCHCARNTGNVTVNSASLHPVIGTHHPLAVLRVTFFRFLGQTDCITTLSWYGHAVFVLPCYPRVTITVRAWSPFHHDALYLV
jgi:hypothetical protein